MNARPILLAISLPALLAVSSFLQQPQKPAIQKSDVQTHAETLMEKARHLSDIRSKGAPAFRLKATFSFIGRDLNTAQGTYSEVWVSSSQWWRETVVNNVRRVEVGGPNRRWFLDNNLDFPETATRVPDLLKLFPASNLNLDFVAPDTTGANTAECTITKPGSRGEKYAFCFDKKTGALLQRVSPDIRPTNLVSYSCVYGIFRKLGDSWFPREMACFEDQHRKLEAKVTDLTYEPAPDADLFKPPPNAIQLADCQGQVVPPTPVTAPPPFQGFFQSGKSDAVTMSVIIENNGRPYRVIKSGRKPSEELAWRTVSGWMYKPGTCDGEKLPMEIQVEVVVPLQ